MSDNGTKNLAAARALIEGLVASGLDHVAIAPGSRSTPLTLAAAESPRVETTVHFDERGLAFYALGRARAQGRPVAIVTTSGTAVANLLPAVIEASNDGVPIILLTADRPPELRGTGANQTIDQIEVFGGYVRLFANLPCADEQADFERFSETAVDAVRAALGSPRGPVHLNCPFREPLVPPAGGTTGFRPAPEPVTAGLIEKDPTIPASDLDRMAAIINSAGPGLLVIGGLPAGVDLDSVSRLADHLGWPVVADISSGLRLGGRLKRLMRSPELVFASGLFPDGRSPLTVLHLGGRVVSKYLAIRLQSSLVSSYIQIAGDPRPVDPAHIVTDFFHADVSETCRALTERVETSEPLATAVHDMEPPEAGGPDEMSEPAVVQAISKAIAPNAALFVASSLPVRLLDNFAAIDGPWVPVGCNRGASGIDGTIAAAVGFARGLDRALTLLTGDLAFLHDLNSLSLLRTSPHPITVVVLNNNGGGIFHLLPVTEYEASFEEFFAAPHGLSFEAAAAQFDLPHLRPTSLNEFISVYRKVQNTASAIIEVSTDRNRTAELWRMAAASVKDNLS